MQTADPTLGTLGRGECLRLLSTVSVGRLVFTVDALPAVQPITFLLDGQRIVFRTTEGTELVALRSGTVVAVEADEIDPATRTGWSVTVVGNAWVLDGNEADAYRRGALRPLTASVRDDVVAVEVAMVTGRRLRPLPNGSAAAGIGHGGSAATQT